MIVYSALKKRLLPSVEATFFLCLNWISRNELDFMVINDFKMSPLSSDVFVFISKHRNNSDCYRKKILHWQIDGFLIYSKRLEKDWKNYLFASSHDAAQNVAMLYSLLGTCKLKGIEPFEWLKSLLEKLPDGKANRLEELLP